MISKISSHLGPGSILLSGSFAPSLVLHLDAGNTFSYSQTEAIGFTVSGGGTTHILDPRVDAVWNTYGGNYLQGGYFQDSATPSAGWYMVDDNGSVRQVLGDAVWFSGGSPTPIVNGIGWFMVLDGSWTIANTQSGITFYETLPTVDITYGGSTWYDLTNLNNDITLSNTTFNATYSQLSQFKGSFEFGGTNSFGSLITGTAIPLMDSHYTIESWIQTNDPLYGLGGIIAWGNYTSNSANVLRQFNNGFANYWVGNNLTVSATFSADYWYHLAATYDGANRTIYLNGESLGTDTPGVSHSVNYFDNLTVGVSNANEFFDGRISTIKVWNKNLNSTQLLSSFNSNKSKYGYDFGSMVFNGSDSYLQTSSGGIYSDLCLGPYDFTVEAFFKSSTASTSYAGIISQRQQGSLNVSINLQNANTSEPLIEFCSGTVSTFTASNNKWYHVAISRTGGTSSFFVNGNLINEVADTTNYDRHDFVVGRYYTDYNDYYFNGLISNARVINETGLYTTSFTPPSTPLSLTQSNTKLLISSQEIDPSADLTGLHSVTASNIGWTSSLPTFYEFYYPDFSSTSGLTLVNTISVVANAIQLTDTSNSYSGNVYRTEAIRFDRSFNLEWSFECGGGFGGADGFCVQWTTTNNTNGGVGGDVGMILDSSTINAFRFQTWTSNDINWYHSNSIQSSQNLSLSIRQNVYYWMDYNYATSTVNIYYSTTNTKPGSSQHTFTGVTFDSTNYYIGFGAATGGSVDIHTLKSMKLSF